MLRIGTLFIALAAAPALLIAQQYPLDRCEAPREPLGYLRGIGEVRYLLKKDGRPDTSSVEVLRVRGISAAGLRSAAIRQLSACKMARPSQDGLVKQVVRFDSVTVALDPAIQADATVPVLTITSPPAPRTTVEPSDTLLEEKPRYVNCSRHPAPPPGPREQTFRSREEMETTLDRESRENSGRILTRLVLDTTGRVIPDSITILSSDNPTVTNNLRSSLSSCRYTPGRIAGIPVRTAIKMGSGIVVTRSSIGP